MMTGKLDAKAAVWAGLVAGFVFILLEMVLVATAGGGSPWAPPRMIGAILLGPDVLPPPASFDLMVFVVAMLVHFVLSIVLAFILAWIIAAKRMGLGAAIGAGAIFGIAVYLVNFYGMTALFPWFAMARNLITIFAHLVFGVVLGWTYHALAIRHYAANAALREHSHG